MASAEPARILNVNVGILGHIDSGKTSLAKALSTLLSTAALDKHPQSAERGITLDLGFSAFFVDLPEHLKALPYDKLQFTLVDCPGHASLIRTIIGGAQIIDIMLLVVDVTKGIQTQTAECLVVGEISPCRDMVIVLNKTDLLPEATRETQIEKMKKRLKLTLKGTKFADSAMVPIAARPGGPEGASAGKDIIGVDTLINELSFRVKEMKRSKDGPFLFAIDHCFPIRGQGTVMTGTVLQGSVSVGQNIELPALKIQKKVKSMQMFHKPVHFAIQGDRVGICVTQLDAKLLERGLAADPGTVPTISGAIAEVEKIRFFKGQVGSKSKMHLTAGHSTVMAGVLFFSSEVKQSDTGFDFAREYQYQEELYDLKQNTPSTSGNDSEDVKKPANMGTQYVLLDFDSPITCPTNALIIGSRLDTDIHSNTCRLAFHGRLRTSLDSSDKGELQRLQVYKIKRREGVIERYVDSNSVIGRGLFKKETDISLFVGLKVTTARGESGTIQSSFGKSGKYKVYFPSGISEGGSGVKLFLEFKRYMFDQTKRMIQT